ncbi:MAG: ParB N-terminal domain-containing protein [Acidobacteria bacterium]|nr:ParB N-terminal domain-containing protein [Acidobacteriota bacterium]
MTLPNHPRIEVLDPLTLIPNPRNARTHSEKQIGQIAASISRFGFAVPITIDDDGNIVAGHGRWLAAKQLGLAEVPVIRVRFLSDTDRRAFALADNRIAELSGWDQNLLAEELSFLLEDGYELEITGFSLSDIDLSIGEAPSDAEERVELPDPERDAITRPGDLWLSGPHRIYCGDSRLATSYEALLADERAAMIVCDPPYNVPIDGHVSGNGKVRHREFAHASGEMSPAEFTAFLRAIFRMCVRFSVDGSIHYQFMDWRHLREILDAGDGIYTEFKQLLVWNKRSAGQGAFYRSKHELICVFKNGRARHQNHFGLERYRTNVLDYAGACGFYKGRKADLESHPTVKSTALIGDLMLDCSSRGDIILDACLGSGTTLLAAHHTGRRGFGIEIDPLYVDTAIRRLTVATLSRAVHADGRTFEEVADQRRAEREATNA